jgi:hypothetical protein
MLRRKPGMTLRCVNTGRHARSAPDALHKKQAYRPIHGLKLPVKQG